MSRQFVVQVTNQPGQMARLAEEMAEAGVDLRAIGGGGLGETGHFIMTTADDDTARKVLQDGGWLAGGGGTRRHGGARMGSGGAPGFSHVGGCRRQPCPPHARKRPGGRSPIPGGARSPAGTRRGTRARTP